MSRRTVAGFLFIAALLGGIALSAQSATPARAPSDELLTEIRGLRADINRVMAAGVKAQLLVGRLQLQEQRIAALNAQVARITADIATHDASRADRASAAERFKNMIASNPAFPAAQRKDLESQIQAMTQQSATEAAEEAATIARLQTELSDLSTQLQQEGARWTYFNDALDQIDAALQPPPRR